MTIFADASALSVWETVAGLRRCHAPAVPAARARVELFPDTGRFQFAGIAEPELKLAADAYDRFGKGRHPQH